MKLKKKEPNIEGIQYTGSNDKEFENLGVTLSPGTSNGWFYGSIFEGTFNLRRGDWLIKTNGEYSVCSKERFNILYEII